ncbi:unnamed protein product, partial [Pleuronectes platessa]
TEVSALFGAPSHTEPVEKPQNDQRPLLQRRSFLYSSHTTLGAAAPKTRTTRCASGTKS